MFQMLTILFQMMKLQYLRLEHILSLWGSPMKLSTHLVLRGGHVKHGFKMMTVDHMQTPLAQNHMPTTEKRQVKAAMESLRPSY